MPWTENRDAKAHSKLQRHDLVLHVTACLGYVTDVEYKIARLRINAFVLQGDRELSTVFVCKLGTQTPKQQNNIQSIRD
jgi:hypothetical protein